MRVKLALITVSLLVGTVAASSSLAGQIRSTAPATDVQSAPMTAPSAPSRRAPLTDGIRLSRPLDAAVAMTSDDCTDLGGSVINDWIGVCASKQVCVRTDNSGKTHAVCLSAK